MRTACPLSAFVRASPFAVVGYGDEARIVVLPIATPRNMAPATAATAPTRAPQTLGFNREGKRPNADARAVQG